MIVGSDERRNACMDEGFNTFIDIDESAEFHHGEFAPKRDGEYAPGGGNPLDEILQLLDDPDAPSLLMARRHGHGDYRHPATYFKSAFGLVLLREQIIGPERFDPAFRKYIRHVGLPPSVALRLLPPHGERERAKIFRGSGAAGTRITGSWTWR